jgi:hypothetical protein
MATCTTSMPACSRCQHKLLRCKARSKAAVSQALLKPQHISCPGCPAGLTWLRGTLAVLRSLSGDSGSPSDCSFSPCSQNSAAAT